MVIKSTKSKEKDMENLEATYKEIRGDLNAEHRTTQTSSENGNKTWSFTCCLMRNLHVWVCMLTLYDDIWRMFFFCFFLHVWTFVDSHALSHKQHKQCRHWNRELIVTDICSFLSLYLKTAKCDFWSFSVKHHVRLQVVFFLPRLVPNRLVFTLARSWRQLRHCCCCNNQLISIIKAYILFATPSFEAFIILFCFYYFFLLFLQCEVYCRGCSVI